MLTYGSLFTGAGGLEMGVQSVLPVYDFGDHVALADDLRERGKLPVDFMLLQPPSWHPDVWTDVARMRTLNMIQAVKGKEQHLCLARGSLVLTRGDGYKPIEQVAPGEFVLTHKGRWRRVLVREMTGVRPVVSLASQGSTITLTPDHKVWARISGRIREREGAEYVTPTWIEAQHVERGYVNHKLAPAEPCNTDLVTWWTVGRWLADGHYHEARDALFISCHTDEVRDLLRSLGRFAPEKIAGTPGPNSAQIRLRDPDGDLRRIIKTCGRGAAGKHLPPEAFTLPAESAKALLDGYLSGDGHLVPGRGRWMATSISRELMLGVAMLAQRACGAIATIRPGRPDRVDVIEGRNVMAQQEWVLSFDLPNARRKTPFVADDGAWKKVRSVRPAGEVETWNLRVEEDESYTAEGMIVKNCPLQFDIVDRCIERWSNPGDTVLDPFGGIMTVPYCAMKLGRSSIGVELNPVYWRDGVAHVEGVVRSLSAPALFDLDDLAS